MTCRHVLRRRTVAAGRQPLIHPAHIDASTASDRYRWNLVCPHEVETEPIRQTGRLREFRNGNQLGHHLHRTGRPVLPDQWMGDVSSGLAFQPLRCVASGVDCKHLCTPAEKSNAAPISDTHKKVQIQGERFGTGENPTTAPVLIAELDFVWSAADDLAQFLTFKQHVAWGLLRYLLSR